MRGCDLRACDPGSLRILRKLNRMSAGAGGPAWLMSHPATEKRIRHIEDLIEQWTGDTAPTSTAET